MKFWVTVLADDRWGIAYPVSNPWKYLDAFASYVANLTTDPQYLRINGKPVIGLFSSSGGNVTMTLSQWQQFLAPMGGQSAVWVIQMSGNTSDFTTFGCQARFKYGIQNLVAGQSHQAWTYSRDKDLIYWTQALLSGESRISQITATNDGRALDSAVTTRTFVDNPTQPELFTHFRNGLGLVGTKHAITFWDEFIEEGAGVSPTVQDGSRMLDVIRRVRSGDLPTSETEEINLYSLGITSNGAGWSYISPFNALSASSHDHDYVTSKTTGDYKEVTRPASTRFVLRARKFTDAGIATIKLDGVDVADVDLYDVATPQHVAVWDSGVLTEGSHTVRVTVKGTKNASSSDFWVYLDSLEVTYNPKTIGMHGAVNDNSVAWYALPPERRRRRRRRLAA
jgi:hypothetical protein